MHDSRGIEIVNFTISLALSAGTLMASAGTPYRLVPAAHFYPRLPVFGTRRSTKRHAYNLSHTAYVTHTHTHTRLTALFPGLPG